MFGKICNNISLTINWLLWAILFLKIQCLMGVLETKLLIDYFESNIKVQVILNGVLNINTMWHIGFESELV